MADLPRAPSKLRSTRPYGTEDEFISGDARCFGRSSIVLLDVGARPPGELVRFEVVLSTGATMLRGEGTVVAHQPASAQQPAGLEVRIARIDARSKALLDRVRAFRTSSRGALSLSPPSSRGSAPGASLPPSSLPSLAPSVAPPSSQPGASLLPAWPSPAVAPSSRSVSEPPPDRASDQSGVHVSRAARGVAAPPNREEILARLRERAGRLAAAGAPLFKRRDAG